MLIDIPDHYLVTLSVIMVRTTAEDIARSGIVPAYVFQYADLWSRGINYGGPENFWQAVLQYDSKLKKILERENLL